MMAAKHTVVAVLASVLYACASTSTMVAQVPPVMPPAGQAGTQGDTLDPNWIPAGFGTLRQDDIALKVSPANGLQVRAIPLDERIIRLLSPDSYRSLRELVTSKERELLAVKERNRLPSYSIWYVSFFAQEQGETRFSPQEFIINNTGRDFRPLDMLPITPGFGEYRLKQREVQSALLIFDGQVDVNQPMSALMESTPSVTDWNRVIQRIERERSLVRSRAAAAPKPPA
jgi:hypothetical protein